MPRRRLKSNRWKILVCRNCGNAAVVSSLARYVRCTGRVLSAKGGLVQRTMPNFGKMKEGLPPRRKIRSGCSTSPLPLHQGSRASNRSRTTIAVASSDFARSSRAQFQLRSCKIVFARHGKRSSKRSAIGKKPVRPTDVPKTHVRCPLKTSAISSAATRTFSCSKTSCL